MDEDYGINEALMDLDELEGECGVLPAPERAAAAARIRKLLKNIQALSLHIEDEAQ